MKTLIIIPSRLSATRLPGKPLLKINGLSIISHVFKIAMNAKIGEVYVAAEDQEIVNDVKNNGGQAILTSSNHKTGTDRIFEALEILGKSNIEYVMNLQGDEPLMNIEDIRNLHKQMIKSKSELGTLASIIKDIKFYKEQNIVKVITKESLENSQFPEAKNFIRKLSEPSKNTYHHLGIYCYQLQTLKRFVSYKQSPNEIKSNLEQLRALDNKIKINVALAKTSPVGVDTEEDFVAIKKIMEYKS
jgi:3-deoxy-manno-octulosonate cytidylyltransferase (CMP-KDO synthetase)